MYEEQKMRDRDTSAITRGGIKDEDMMVKQKRRGPRCHYCKKFGHIQRNCHEREKKFEGSSQQTKNTRHRVNTTEARSRDDNSDSDEVGLVIRHALSAGVDYKSFGDRNWIIDSGATCHICHDHNSFVELNTLEKPLDVTLGDGHTLKAVGHGTVILILKSGCLTRKCKLNDVLYVPELTYNLLSVSKAVEKGITVTFNERGCVIKDTNQSLITVATKVGNLYHLLYAKSKDHVYSVAEKLDENGYSSKEDLWHRRYGHLGVKTLQKLARDHLVNEYDFCVSKQIKFCEPCLKGKHRRSQFPPYSERTTTEPLELVHSDVCGKLNSKSLSGAEYFVTFINDKTRYVWVYVIKQKSDVFERFCEWKAEVEKLLGRSLKTLRTDNGGEFTSEEFEEYLRKEGIKHELTIPKCPEQNGVAEQLNRTLMEMVRSMLADSELPKSFWAEALSTAVYLRNRSPTKAVEGKTPYEAIHGEKPKVGHLRIFGCTALFAYFKRRKTEVGCQSSKMYLFGLFHQPKGVQIV